MLRAKAGTAAATTMQGRKILALGAGLRARMGEALGGVLPELGSVSQLGDLTPGAFDLIMIDADAWDAPALAAAVKTLTGMAACPPVLVTGENLPAALIRNLLRLEAADILEAPFTAEQLASAAQTLLEARKVDAPPPPSGSARCWAVSGAVGGSGATTIAIEIAHALSTIGKDKRVCLIDLNLADGAAAAYLGVKPTVRMADYGNAADRIDAAMLQAMVTPVSKGLDLIAGVRDAMAFDALGRDSVLRMLEVACECYDWVILDMPRHRRSWTLEALSGCDEILVISELTVPALLAARAHSDEIEEGLGTGLRPRIVLNRLASRVFGPAPSMTEAEKALQRKAEAGVSSDWEAAAASANLGGPIAQHRPKSKIVKDIHSLVERLAVQSARREAAVRAA